MIDIENQVFNAVATALRARFPQIFVAGETVASPASFPAVTIVEADNSIYTRTKDLSGVENHSIVMYEINVYSNLASGKKAQCKSVMSVIDAEMQALSFARIACMPMPNIDNSIYRMIARYRAVVNKNKQIQKIV